MGLRLKTAIAVTTVFLAIIGATYLLFTNVLLGEFDRIERERTTLNMNRVFQSIEGVHDDLRGRVLDWARWDETYELIQGENKSYIESNLNYEAVAPFELVHIVIIKKDGSLVFGGEVRNEEENLKPIPAETLTRILSYPAIADYLREPTHDPLKGLMKFGDDPLFVAVSPITDNQMEKPYNGFLIFTRAFSPTLQANINKRTQLSLLFSILHHAPEHGLAASKLPSYTTSIQTTDQEIVSVGTITDFSAMPVVEVRLRAPRTIYKQGKASRDYVVLLMAIFLIAANAVLIFFLNRTVIGRLVRFASRISTIEKTQNFALRVEEEGHDEIGSLSRTFNGLLRTTEDTTAKLIAARDEAMRATHAKSAFVAHVSHELRTPIHSLSGLLRILFKKEDVPAKRAYIQMAQDAASTLLSTINHILDLSKIESGTVELQKLPISLRDVCRIALRTVTPRIDEKPLVQFLFDIEPGVPDSILGDPLRLQQILINLLANAAKFTHEGTITLRIRACETTPHAIRFEITDTGIGMSEEQLGRIFRPYAQADDSIQSRYQGTGLGLSIVQQIVNQLGGLISVRSVLGKGSTFEVSLPVDQQEGGTSSAPSSSIMHGVIVDEETTYSAWMRESFARHGCTLARVSPYDSKALVELVARKELGFVLLPHHALQVAELREALPWLRRKAPYPVIASVRLSDMETHDHLQNVGGICVLDAPTPAEEIIRTALIARSADQSTTPHSTLSQHSAAASPVRVLVADDAPTSRLIIREILEEGGYIVETVENGKEALARLQRENHASTEAPISVVLTDIEMPEMNGMELARALRSMESITSSQRHLPIIAITAHALTDEQEKMRASGIDFILTKPLNPLDLAKALSNISTQSSSPTSPSMSPNQTDSTRVSLRALTEHLWREVSLDNGPTASSMPSLAIDIEDVLERSGDSPRRTKMILQAFLDSYAEHLSRIRPSDTAASSLQELIISAHSLKGLLLDIGAKHTAGLAASIEAALKAGDELSVKESRERCGAQIDLVAALAEQLVQHFPVIESR